MKTNITKNKLAITAPLVLFFAMFCLFMIIAMIYPSPQTIKTFILIIGLIFCIFAKEEHLIYLSCVSVFFPFHLRYFGTITNGILCMTSFVLFVRYSFTKTTILSKKYIYNSYFFLPSLMIFLCYFISLLPAFFQKTAFSSYHFVFLEGLFSILLFGNILNSFLTSKERLINVLTILLIMLIFNLLFGIITLVKPSFVIVPGYFQSGAVVTDTETIKGGAIRLSGLNFQWEGYAEYLMMATIVFAGLLMNLKMNTRRKIFLVICLIVCTAELLLCNTRGAVVCTVFGCGLLLLTNTEFSFMKKTLYTFLLCLTMVIAIFFASATGYLRLKERFGTFSAMEKTTYGYMPKARAGAWVPALDKITKDNFLGSGPSLYPYTFYPPEKLKGISWPHNLTLIILATTGLYGFFSYLFLLIRSGFIFKKSKTIKEPFCRAFFYSAGFSILVFIVESQKFDGFLRQTDSIFYFIWLWIAIFFSAQNFIYSYDA